MDQSKVNYFKNKGLSINGIVCLSPEEAYQLLKENADLVDLRKNYETNFRVVDVPRVCFCSEDDLKSQPVQLSRSKPLILLDNVGLISRRVAQYLNEQGYENVAIVAGGIIEWCKQNFPVQKDPNYELRGQCGCRIQPINPKDPPKVK